MFYSLWKFSSFILVDVYIPPQACGSYSKYGPNIPRPLCIYLLGLYDSKTQSWTTYVDSPLSVLPINFVTLITLWSIFSQSTGRDNNHLILWLGTLVSGSLTSCQTGSSRWGWGELVPLRDAFSPHCSSNYTNDCTSADPSAKHLPVTSLHTDRRLNSWPSGVVTTPWSWSHSGDF